MSTTSLFVRAARLLLACVDRHTAWRLTGANLLAIAGGLLSGLAPLALKGLVDAAGHGRGISPRSMAGLAVAYLLCLCATRLLSELRPAMASAAEQRLYSRLRLRFFAHTLALPLGFHLDKRSGAVAHALQQGISGYQVILFSVVNSIVPVLFEGLTMMLVLLSLRQPILTAIFAATALSYVMATLSRGGALKGAARDVSSASADVGSLLTEALTNIEPVKCFGVEPRLVQDYARATRVLEWRWSRLHRARLRNGAFILAIFMLSVGSSVLAASDAFTRGALTVGGFVLANTIMLQVLRPMEMLVSAAHDVMQALAFIDPMLTVLDTPRSGIETVGRLTHPTPHGDAPKRTQAASNEAALFGSPRAARPGMQFQAIRLQNIWFAIDERHTVFRDLTLDLPAGRCTAIVGASGCGKSSLVRLLLGLWTPQRGQICMDEVAIQELSPETLRASIAVVPQDTVLFNTTIGANIAIGKPKATTREIEEAARLACLHDRIAALPAGYDTAIGERGLKLSGGERQRIAIARAILRDPAVYVLDEATSMLDGPTELAVLRNLRDLSAGRTMIMIAHRLSTLQHADGIVVLANGQVAEQGTHAALLARGGTYAALWRAQSGQAA